MLSAIPVVSPSQQQAWVSFCHNLFRDLLTLEAASGLGSAGGGAPLAQTDAEE
jgi:hypothetical protein